MPIKKYFDQLPNRYNDIRSLICVVGIPCESINSDSYPTIQYFYQFNHPFTEPYEYLISNIAPSLQMVLLPLLHSFIDTTTPANIFLEYQMPGSNNNFWIRINAHQRLDSFQKKYLIVSLWKENNPNISKLRDYPLIIRNRYPKYNSEFVETFKQRVKDKITPYFSTFSKKQTSILKLEYKFNKKEIAGLIDVSPDTVDKYSKGMTTRLGEKWGFQFDTLKQWSLFFHKLSLL